jgi:hypothetical protein
MGAMSENNIEVGASIAVGCTSSAKKIDKNLQEVEHT